MVAIQIPVDCVHMVHGIAGIGGAPRASSAYR